MEGRNNILVIRKGILQEAEKEENSAIKQTTFETNFHCILIGISLMVIYICNERKIQFRAVERNLAGTSRIGVVNSRWQRATITNFSRRKNVIDHKISRKSISNMANLKIDSNIYHEISCWSRWNLFSSSSKIYELHERLKIHSRTKRERLIFFLPKNINYFKILFTKRKIELSSCRAIWPKTSLFLILNDYRVIDHDEPELNS